MWVARHPRVHPFEIEICETASLGSPGRAELVELAEAVTASLCPGYLDPRWSTYPTVAIARQGGAVAGFFLLEERRTPHLALLYIGPAFSRGGAYIALFASVLGERLRRGEEFCVAMELESEACRQALARLLPSTSHPRPGEPPTPSLRALARAFADHFEHIRDLDEATLSTGMSQPISGEEVPARYSLALVPCTGIYERRRTLARELEQGLVSLEAHRRWTGGER
jgi:hypothetical protein